MYSFVDIAINNTHCDWVEAKVNDVPVMRVAFDDTSAWYGRSGFDMRAAANLHNEVATLARYHNGLVDV